MQRRSAYLGGTFDPVHAGHIGFAQAVLDGGFTDRVVFAPAFAPPHKLGRAISEYRHRYRMLELATAGKAGLAVSDCEERFGLRPSFTYEVLRRLRAEAPEERWQLLIGADTLMTLHSWYCARELVDAFEILTAPRPGIVIEEKKLKVLWGDAAGTKLLSGVMKLPTFDISSTEIREKIGKIILLPEIQSYIESEGLYAQDQSRR